MQCLQNIRWGLFAQAQHDSNRSRVLFSFSFFFFLFSLFFSGLLFQAIPSQEAPVWKPIACPLPQQVPPASICLPLTAFGGCSTAKQSPAFSTPLYPTAPLTVSLCFRSALGSNSFFFLFFFFSSSFFKKNILLVLFLCLFVCSNFRREPNILSYLSWLWDNSKSRGYAVLGQIVEGFL